MQKKEISYIMVLHYKRKEGFPEAAYMGGFVVQLENDMKTIKTLPVATVPGKLQSVGTPYEDTHFWKHPASER